MVAVMNIALVALAAWLSVFVIVNITKNGHKECTPGDDCDRCPFPLCGEHSEEEIE